MKSLTMKRLIPAVCILSIVVGLLLAACAPQSSQNIYQEQQTQAAGMKAILDNQPVPDLGGRSFERQVLIDTYIARNKQVNTYTYIFSEYTNTFTKLCDSKGYPIPYSTELTNPTQAYNGVTVSNPEPNGVYPPPTANATLVQCVLGGGKVAPIYVENNVIAFPYPIQSEKQVQPAGDSSFTLNLDKFNK